MLIISSLGILKSQDTDISYKLSFFKILFNSVLCQTLMDERLFLFSNFNAQVTMFRMKV